MIKQLLKIKAKPYQLITKAISSAERNLRMQYHLQ
jgi:hypothetical protein